MISPPGRNRRLLIECDPDPNGDGIIFEVTNKHALDAKLKFGEKTEPQKFRDFFELIMKACQRFGRQ